MIRSRGYRGYISSRSIRGQDVPHQFQNMVVREYCRRNKIQFQLSATEYAVPHCYIMLTELLNSLGSIQGIVLYSQFLLPYDRLVRRKVYDQVIEGGCELHAALENTAIRTAVDINSFEDSIAIVNLLPEVPMAGLYDKSNKSEELETFKNLVL